jgi:hypothetical protein
MRGWIGGAAPDAPAGETVSPRTPPGVGCAPDQDWLPWPPPSKHHALHTLMQPGG